MLAVDAKQALETYQNFTNFPDFCFDAQTKPNQTK